MADDNDVGEYRTAFDVSLYATGASAALSLVVATAVRWYRIAAADDRASSSHVLRVLLDIPLALEVVLWLVVVGFVCLTLLIVLPGPYPIIPVRASRGIGGRVATRCCTPPTGADVVLGRIPVQRRPRCRCGPLLSVLVSEMRVEPRSGHG